MAGPFQTSGNNAADLAPVQVQGGFAAPASPTNPTQEAISSVTDAVKTIATVNTQRLEKEAVTNIRQEVRAVRDALQLSKFPNLQSTYFSDESLKDPYVASVYKNFQEIKNASDQGRLTQEFALERMESLMSQAINRRPQFADEIRSAANTAAGANISSKVFSSIMAQTPQQQALATLQVEAAKRGVPVETYASLAQQSFFREQMSAQIEFSKQKGTLTLSEMTQQVGLEVTNLTREIQDSILLQMRQGGIVDTPTTINQARSLFQSVRAKVMGNIPSNVDASAVSRTLELLDKEEARVLQQIETGSMQNILQTEGALFEEVAKDNARVGAPDEMQLIALFGEQTGLEAINMYNKYKNNPQAMAGLYAVDEGGLLTIAQAMRQNFRAGQILNGEVEAANDTERRLAGYFGGVWLQRDASNTQQPASPQEVTRAVDVVAKMGEEYSTATLADQRVATTIKNYKETHPQIINHFNSDVRALQRKYEQLKAEGAFTDDNVVIKNGVVSVSGSTIVKQFGAGQSNPANLTGGTGSLTSIQQWLRQANLALKMGQTYQANGVFPDSVFKNANSFLDSLKVTPDLGGEELTGGEDGPEVIHYDFDSDGNLIRVEQ